MTKTYRAYVDGFFGNFASVGEIQNWIDELHARFGLTGKTLKVWKGTRYTDFDTYKSAMPIFSTVL